MSNNKNTNNTSSKKNNKHLKIILLSLLFIIIIISITSALIINNYLNKINKSNINKNEIVSEEISAESNDNDVSKNSTTKNNDIRNIAIFGVDECDGNYGRSDCIMILTVDNTHDKLKLSSIIRDSYVDIPSRNSKDKLNHAYAFGGPQLALKTINENFGLNVTQFASVNFSSFPKIIDDIGGITLDITNDELNFINYSITELNSLNKTQSPYLTASGEQKLNGTQTLAYSRIRSTDGGDFARSHRHRIVLVNIFKALRSLPIAEYPNMLNELLPLINTNLQNSEILSLGMDLNSLKNTDIIQNRFPKDEDGEGKLISGVYYYVFDKDSTISKIHKFIYEE